MLKRTHARSLIVALAFTCAGCDLRSLLGESPPPVAQERQPAPPPVGRYQVVNPTPGFTSNTMLLDTVTGRTWLLCALTKDGKRIEGTEGSGWCDMTQADERGAP